MDDAVDRRSGEADPLAFSGPRDVFDPSANETKISKNGGCYKCGSAVDRLCVLCGNKFCTSHGGKRWVCLAENGKRSGVRNRITKRVVCDGCTENFFVVVARYLLNNKRFVNPDF